MMQLLLPTPSSSKRIESPWLLLPCKQLLCLRMLVRPLVRLLRRLLLGRLQGPLDALLPSLLQSLLLLLLLQPLGAASAMAAAAESCCPVRQARTPALRPRCLVTAASWCPRERWQRSAGKTAA